MAAHRHFSNQEVATILREMAALYEMQDVAFKPRAYDRAAHGVESFEENLQDLFAERGDEALMHIPGVGKGIARHLKELFTTGHFKEYEKLKRKAPVDIVGLMALEGVGPKTIKVLWEKLGVRSVNDLEKAARAGKIAKLPRFGKRTEEKILKSIEFMRARGTRFILGFIAPEVERMRTMLERIPEIGRVEVAGSYRRRKETIGDIDVLITSAKPRSAVSKILALTPVAHVYGMGPTKINLRLKSGIDVDIRIVPEKSWGAALNYFTGSKLHNIALRTMAQKRGWKLSEYGLFHGKIALAGKTEKEVYERLGLPYIEPELREMTGELEAAQAGKLPHLVGYGDLRGDLQVQTNWTDGSASIEKMADAAEAAGLEYIVITDHTMAHGLDEQRLLDQKKEIERINKKRKRAGKKLHILSGAEVNIRKDGTLDIEDDVLSQLDVVGAAIHSHFDLPKREQTARLIRAMENPHVDIIFHPTCRLINARPEINLAIDEMIMAAKRTGTVLEIDAYPDRLDLRDEYVRACVEAGVLMSIDSDAHAPEHFSVLKFGIGTARRGWAEKRHIINTLPHRTLLRRLKHAGARSMNVSRRFTKQNGRRRKLT